MGGSGGGGWERGEARERLGGHHPIFFGGTPSIHKMMHTYTTVYNFIVGSFLNIFQILVLQSLRFLIFQI